ncbi:MAG: hypothetical protein O7C62_05940 [Rickettsia endosymbiont of Ixodes persulcatus]|nr:hypothetical protein [Rickettsia endosymbiont of Ixodes persulcatus]
MLKHIKARDILNLWQSLLEKFESSIEVDKKSYGAIQRYQYGCRTRTKVYLTVPISYGLAIYYVWVTELNEQYTFKYKYRDWKKICTSWSEVWHEHCRLKN